jgi:hypothetical protein
MDPGGRGWTKEAPGVSGWRLPTPATHQSNNDEALAALRQKTAITCRCPRQLSDPVRIVGFEPNSPNDGNNSVSLSGAAFGWRGKQNSPVETPGCFYLHSQSVEVAYLA